MLTYSVVICTLNRPDELKRCILSWLRQDPLPLQIVVVHGRLDDDLSPRLNETLKGTGVELVYLRTAPSLVRQRNLGATRARGDVVVFADDDAEYLDGYAPAVLEAYESDRCVGGAQGTILNEDRTVADRFGLATIFMLPRLGDGSLQPSAWPSFYRGSSPTARVRVFSGAAMSYRRDVLQDFSFDEDLAHYWVGDDFEMAYRVSNRHTLLQVAAARLIHYESPASRDGARRKAKMFVVNHLYLSRKCFGRGWRFRAAWAWSELGMWVVAALWLLSGRGPERLQGMVDGYRELWATGSGTASPDVGERMGKGGSG
jgi:GT2 family glycosyltransferase